MSNTFEKECLWVRYTFEKEVSLGTVPYIFFCVDLDKTRIQQPFPLLLIQEGLLSVTGERMGTKYWKPAK